MSVYLHLGKPEKMVGIFNAGFENLSIMEIAERVNFMFLRILSLPNQTTPVHTGFLLKSYLLRALLRKAAEEGILGDRGFQPEKLAMEEKYFNVKTMVRLIKKTESKMGSRDYPMSTTSKIISFDQIPAIVSKEKMRPKSFNAMEP